MQRSDDIGTGVYGGGRYLARWTLIDGRPCCPDAPLILDGALDATVAATIAVNRAVAAIAAHAEQVEAAAAMAAREPPPVTVLSADGDPDAPPMVVPNPARAEWDAAVALLADVAGDDDLQHLLRTRADALSCDDAGQRTEAAWSLSLPPVPDLAPLTQTADWDGAAWVVRALTAEERAIWPLQPPPVPATVSRVQLRLALAARGLLATVDGAVQLTGDTELTERWGAAVMERASPYLAEMASALGLSQVDIDDIFRAAADL